LIALEYQRLTRSTRVVTASSEEVPCEEIDGEHPWPELERMKT
jgi:hypothetical protein